MLSALIRDHNLQQTNRRNELEKKRFKAIDSTNKFSQLVLDRLNKDVTEAFINQKKIDAKIRLLNQNTAQFLKQNQLWIQTLENFNSSLKELGDVENWSKKIVTDMEIINSTLDQVLNKETNTTASSS